jgi:NhaP-type Na+/H+ and K+/H+ antiporter
MTPPFEHLSALALAVLAFAGAELVGGNGLIAAFVCGLVLGNTASAICDSLHALGEAKDSCSRCSSSWPSVRW